MLGDPPPQWDEEPEWESEMHNGSWTKNTKSTVAEQIRWDQNQDRIMESPDPNRNKRPRGETTTHLRDKIRFFN
jgi:hypothetical protein